MKYSVVEKLDDEVRVWIHDNQEAAARHAVQMAKETGGSEREIRECLRTTGGYMDGDFSVFVAPAVEQMRNAENDQVTVGELIGLLSHCEPDAVVMFERDEDSFWDNIRAIEEQEDGTVLLKP